MSVFQDPTTPDSQDVIRAASHLRISEFTLFRCAYEEWFGTEADERTIERYFVSYLVEQETPGWIRSFTRRVLRKMGEGNPARVGFGSTLTKLSLGDYSYLAFFFATLFYFVYIFTNVTSS